jgi:hypothetical protein
LVLVNGWEYQTDLAYGSDGMAMENAAMRAYMYAGTSQSMGVYWHAMGLSKDCLPMKAVVDTGDEDEVAIAAAPPPHPV